jgi:hypothetical protein
MSADQFLVFGSILTKGAQAHDIDLVAAEFYDPTGECFADGDGVLTLDRYEALAHRTGKRIDLFFSVVSRTFNLAAVYDPRQERPRWEFRQAFCGRDFFYGVQPITEAELVAAATNSGRSFNLPPQTLRGSRNDRIGDI